MVPRVEALEAGPGSPERERYIFREGTGAKASEPPSDWRSHFGGSAWQHVGDGQWYCHLFAREQPDLNWDNTEVREYFLDTLRFWADRGVDGFRIDVAHALAKELSEPLRSQPNLDSLLPLDGTDPLYDRDKVHEIYRTWRAVFDEYDPPRMAVAETWHPTTSRTYLYSRPDELGQIFDFSLLKAEWHPEQFRRVITRSLHEHHGVGGGATWVLSSHDVPRHATRHALPVGTDLDRWLRRSLTAVADDAFSWVESGNPQVLRFARSEDWECLINFSTQSVPIPGQLLLSSDPESRPDLPPEAAAWFRPS